MQYRYQISYRHRRTGAGGVAMFFTARETAVREPGWKRLDMSSLISRCPLTKDQHCPLVLPVRG